MGPVRSDSYFYDPFRSTQPLGLPFCQRLQAASYGLFDVLQGFIHAATLRVASGECGAAHNVAALFSFLKDDFKIHCSNCYHKLIKGFQRTLL